jgi:hypothetical protein
MRLSVCAVALLLLCSCSNVPKPASYVISTQQKMQAVHHWDVLADDVAKDVKLTLQGHALADKQIYLEPNDGSIFTEVFDNLLATELFKQGVTCTKSDNNSVKLTYEAQIVRHKADRFTSPFYPGEILSLTAIGTGVYKAFEASNTPLGVFAAAGALEVINDVEFEWWRGVPHCEVAITTELTSNDQVIARNTGLYYINDADEGHYLNLTARELSTKRYTVVND